MSFFVSRIWRRSLFLHRLRLLLLRSRKWRIEALVWGNVRSFQAWPSVFRMGVLEKLGSGTECSGFMARKIQRLDKSMAPGDSGTCSVVVSSMPKVELHSDSYKNDSRIKWWSKLCLFFGVKTFGATLYLPMVHNLNHSCLRRRRAQFQEFSPSYQLLTTAIYCSFPVVCPLNLKTWRADFLNAS